MMKGHEMIPPQDGFQVGVLCILVLPLVLVATLAASVVFVLGVAGYDGFHIPVAWFLIATAMIGAVWALVASARALRRR